MKATGGRRARPLAGETLGRVTSLELDSARDADTLHAAEGRGSWLLLERETPLLTVLTLEPRNKFERVSEDRLRGLASAGLPTEEVYECVAIVGEPEAPAAAYCRSLAWQEQPADVAEAVRRLERFVIPGVQQNEGFQGGVWLADHGSGRCVGFTFWDSLRNFERSGAVGRALRREAEDSGGLQVRYLRNYVVVHSPASGRRLASPGGRRAVSRLELRFKWVKCAERFLSIGEVAALAGIETSAIRYYERRGLLAAPDRVSGRRVYAPAVVDRLQLIAMAKDAGFTLEETKRLLAGLSARSLSRRWRELATAKLTEIDALIARAESMRAILHEGLECDCLTLADCAPFLARQHSRQRM